MGRLLRRNLQPSLFSHILVSCISSKCSPLISLSFLICSMHLVLGISLGNFSINFLCSIFFSLIRITCPNYLNVLFWKQSFISSTPSSNLITVFLSCPPFFCLKLLSKVSFSWLEFYFHSLSLSLFRFLFSSKL